MPTAILPAKSAPIWWTRMLIHTLTHGGTCPDLSWWGWRCQRRPGHTGRHLARHPFGRWVVWGKPTVPRSTCAEPHPTVEGLRCVRLPSHARYTPEHWARTGNGDTLTGWVSTVPSWQSP